MPITGNNGNNVLVGTQGDDEILGLGGTDVLIGSGGKDTLDGGTEADTMDGGAGDDTYIVDNSGDQVVEYENKGKDTVKSSVTFSLNNAQHVENLTLTGSADINGYGNGLDNVINGNSGDNDLLGYGGDDLIKGGGGSDYISGGLGDDDMYGGTGDDTFVVDSTLDTVTEFASQGTDKVMSSVSWTLGANIEKLTLTGMGNINAFGNELNNEIIGNIGNNYINGGAGADKMTGGLGNDGYVVDNFFDQVFENAGEGTDHIYSSLSSYGLSANLEHLTLTGNLDSSGYGNSLDNHIYGNAGDNTLVGNGGHDALIGGFGADKMYGGEGNDGYEVNEDGDVVTELANEGIDSVHTYGDMDYILPDNVENLYLDSMGHGNGTGNELDNILWGTIHDGVLDGGAGIDSMYGGSGDDEYHVDEFLDQAIEGVNQGMDTVFSSVSYKLGDHVEILSLAGGSGIEGTGNAQSNTIYGNAGDNVLDGGGGTDSLSGLGGNDSFVFKAGEAHGDVVYEFEGNGTGAGDMLKFVGYGAGATLTQFSADVWIIASLDGSIQEAITFVGAPALVGQDCIFV